MNHFSLPHVPVEEQGFVVFFKKKLFLVKHNADSVTKSMVECIFKLHTIQNVLQKNYFDFTNPEHLQL